MAPQLPAPAGGHTARLPSSVQRVSVGCQNALGSPAGRRMASGYAGLLSPFTLKRCTPKHPLLTSERNWPRAAISASLIPVCSWSDSPFVLKAERFRAVEIAQNEGVLGVTKRASLRVAP